MVHGLVGLGRLLAALLLAAGAVAWPPGTGPEQPGSLERLVSWLEEDGGSLDPRVSLVTDGELGRGLAATEDVPAGQMVLRVPLSRCVNVEHALADEGVGAIVDRLDWLPDADALALLLLRHSALDGSFYSPYLGTLVDGSVAATPLLFSAAELAGLQASPARKRAESLRSQVAGAFRRLLEEAPELGPLLGRPLEEEDYARTVALVHSRVFGVRVRDRQGQWQDTKALVPLADLVNYAGPASGGASLECFTEPDSPHFACRTSRPVQRGQQLLGSYGLSLGPRASSRRLSNAALLVEYGFALENNTYDAARVELPPVDPEDEGYGKEDGEASARAGRWAPLELRRQRAALLSRNGLANAPPWVHVSWHDFPLGAFARLRVTCMGAREFAEVERSAEALAASLENLTPGAAAERLSEVESAARSMVDSFLRLEAFSANQTELQRRFAPGAPHSLFPWAEAAAARLLARQLAAALAEYGTALEADEAELARGPEGTRLHVLRVVAGEKRLLRHWHGRALDYSEAVEEAARSAPVMQPPSRGDEL